MALLHEQIDGKYEILHKIKEGGMGAIYKVRHRLLDEIRVVKVIRSHADPAGEAGERFLREARVAIRLRHPNIATLHDFAISEDGQAFIVMEYIDGWTLLEVLQGYGPPPLPLVLEIARQSLRALGYLHRQKIVHRDVSPDNLMLTRDVDGNPEVKLIDLGIAKTLEGEVHGLTTTGIFLGKPRYGSPERFSDRGFDERSDLYSFGVVFYELLTGRCPIRGTDAASFMAGHLFRPPSEFAETDPGNLVPEDLRRLVLRSLEKRPEDRVASADAFLRELEPIQARYPLTGHELASVFGVLRPVAAVEGTGDTPDPGSTQSRLDLEFGLEETPPPETWSREEATRIDRLGALETLEMRPGARSEADLAKVLPHPGAGGSPALADPTLPVLVSLGERAIQPSEATVRSERPLDLNDMTLIRNGPRREPEAPLDMGPATGPPPEEKKPASRRPALLVLALVVAGSLGTGAWWTWRSRSVPAPQDVAETRPVPIVVPASSSPPASVSEPSPTPDSPETASPPGPPVAEKPEAPVQRTASAPDLAPDLAPEPAPVEEPGPFQRGGLIRPGPGVEVPLPLDIPPYPYPEAARGTGRKANVRVALLVDEEGRVLEARVREGDSSGLGFNEVALETARKIQFQPATRDDVPGKMWTELIFPFEERSGPPDGAARLP